MNKNVLGRAGLVPSAFSGLLAAVISALAIAAVCALAAISMPDPGKYAGIFALAALFVSAFAGGFTTARKKGDSTLICGALTAALALAAVSLLALIFSVKMNVSAFALRALGVLICSVLGANIGVGSRTEGKRKKKNAHRTRG